MRTATPQGEDGIHMRATRHEPSLADLVTRLRREFEEMPGMSLTQAQASRLCGLPEPMCGRLLDGLVEARALTRTPDGRYRRYSAA